MDRKQKRFIKKKVKSLGSRSEAKLFYRSNDAVSKFANDFAEEIFPVEITRRKKK